MLIYQDEVRPEWTDNNGHMRDAYYLLLFSLATDALMDAIGLDHPGTLPAAAPGDDLALRRGHSLFTLQCNLHYLHEVREGAKVEVHTRVLAHDAKRLHLYSILRLAGDARVMAAAEQMQLHVDMSGPRAAPFQPESLVKVQALTATDAAQPWPALAGKLIALPQR